MAPLKPAASTPKKAASFGGPDQLSGQHARVGDVGQAIPLRRGTRELERAPGFLADGRVHGQGGAQVHRIADRQADHRMRAVHGPGEAVTPGRGIDFVFLGVIEILEGQARLAFAQRGVGQGARAGVGFERAQVVFQAGHQRDVAHAVPWRQRVEQVAHQGGIDADVLGFGVLAHPGGDEDVGRRDVGQRGAQGCGVEQVGGDVAHGGQVLWGAARQADHVPARGQQFARDMVAADAGDADDQCGSFHVLTPDVTIEPHSTGWGKSARRPKRNGAPHRCGAPSRSSLQAIRSGNAGSARCCAAHHR